MWHKLTDSAKGYTEQLLSQVCDDFKNKTLDVATLQCVLDKTKRFLTLRNNTVATDYQSFIENSLTNPRPAMKTLLQLMAAIQLIGGSVLLRTAGFGILPVGGVAALGVFGPGASLIGEVKETADENALINHFTKPQ
jgi:hypothetical protein